jgi:hypothetical protein
VLTLDQVRRLALALPEVVEQDHHGMASFRVRGTILATVPDDGHVRVMLPEEAIRAAVAEAPDSCSPFFWGARLSCVVVDLSVADPDHVHDLLADAWRVRAPASLRAAYDARPSD